MNKPVQLLVPRRFLALAAVSGMIAGGGFLAGRATADQPHMQAARRALNNARTQLKIAEADKDGHRDKAIGLVDQALGEVALGIKAGRGK